MAKRSYVLEGIIGSGEENRRVQLPLLIVRASTFERAAKKLGGEAVAHEGVAHAKFQPIPGCLGNLAHTISTHASASCKKEHKFSDSLGAMQLLKQCTAFRLLLLPVID